MESTTSPQILNHNLHCMVCHRYSRRLYRHLPVHYKGMSDVEAVQKYRIDFSISDDVHLIAPSEGRRMSELKKSLYNSKAGDEVRKKIASSLSGRARPDLRGRTGRRPSGRTISRWSAAQLLAKGVGVKSAAKQLGAPNWKQLQRIGQAIGLAFGTAFILEQGRPFTHGSLSKIREISGCTDVEFSKFVGVSTRQVSTIESGRIVQPKVARRVSAWRDGVLRQLLAERSHKSYRKDAVLKSLVPELSEVNGFLLKTIEEVRQETRKFPLRTANDLGEFLCVKAQQHRSGGDWKKTLGYFAELPSGVIDEFLRRARGAELNGKLVRWLIGGRWGASAGTVQNALRRRCNSISPAAMLMLILRYGPAMSSNVQQEKRRKAPGRPAMSINELNEQQVGAAVEARIGNFVVILEKKRGLPRRIRWDHLKCSAELERLGHSHDESKAASQSKNALLAARRFVARTENLAYDTVAEYHRNFLKKRSR
jgi:hypothetical protein